jgi:hypothetical protein
MRLYDHCADRACVATDIRPCHAHAATGTTPCHGPAAAGRTARCPGVPAGSKG